jgi:hypothetical protein
MRRYETAELNFDLVSLLRSLIVCLFQTQSSDEPFPTTSQDLAGFWDMVMIQVDDVNRLFAEIDSLKKNGWKEVQQPASVRCHLLGFS